jgi:sterol desaturase/sphingolipid hydroxylase (fatty acid hydroxylase superfamily)
MHLGKISRIGDVMRLGKFSYYADFVVYPLVIAALAAFALWQTPQSWHVWLGAFVIGVAGWTLIEYLLHRFVLHHVPYIKDMHDAHHHDQLALIGTPIWISLAIMVVVVLVPLSMVVEQHVAIGLACGLMFGHFWYGGVHHILHHWNIQPGTYGYRLKRRHMLHHHFDEMGNFGVTSGFWDVVFGTDVKVRVAPARERERRRSA